MIICLIDDDDLVRDAIALNLADSGHIVVAARSGTEGLELLEQGQVDAFVTDFKMRGLTGVDLTAIVRRRFPTLPIVVVSGEAMPAGLEQADVFLPKPFTSKKLIAAIEEARGKRQNAA